MRPVTVTQTGTGSSSLIPMDFYLNPFNIGLGIVVTGTVNYTVQHTFDDVFASNYDPSTGNWFNHPVLASLDVNADGNYAFPCSAIRVTVNSGDGSAAITVIQAGATGS